jgi:hypothetical protein
LGELDADTVLWNSPACILLPSGRYVPHHLSKRPVYPINDAANELHLALVFEALIGMRRNLVEQSQMPACSFKRSPDAAGRENRSQISSR